MKKSLRCSVLILVALVQVVLTGNIVAQERSLPSKSAEENRILKIYIDISSRSIEERRKLFSELSAKDKADNFKLHLAMQLVRRPNLNVEQKDLILHTIPTISSEGYEKPGQVETSLLQQKAKLVFSKQEGAEIFANLGGDIIVTDFLQKYIDFCALPSQHRRDAFNAASVNEKSGLWQVHLAAYLAAHPELTKVQRALILEAIGLAGPQNYELSAESSEWKIRVEAPIQSFAIRALEVFPKKQGADIFYNLGGGEAQPCSIKPASEDTSKTILGDPMRVVAPNCACSRQSDWCWETCIGVGCQQTTSGCGTMWQYPCDHNGCS